MKTVYLLFFNLILFQCTFAQKISYNNVVAYSPPPGIDGPVADYTVQQALTLIEGAYISCTPSVTLLRLKAVIFRGARYEISQLPSDVAAKLENSARGSTPDFCYSILNGGTEKWQGCGGYNRPRWVDGVPDEWKKLFEKGNLSIGKVYIKNGFVNPLLIQEYLINSKKSQQAGTDKTTATPSSSSPTTQVTVTNADNDRVNPMTVTNTGNSYSNNNGATNTKPGNSYSGNSNTTSANNTSTYNNPVENSYRATGLSNTSANQDISNTVTMGVGVFSNLFSGNGERKRKKDKKRQEWAAQAIERSEANQEVDRKKREDKALRDYLTSNSPGVKFEKTSSGMYYYVHKKGKGSNISPGQMIKLIYDAYYITGSVKKFDSNIDSAFHHVQPWEIKVGNGDCIPGLDEGLALFNKGSAGALYIPSYLAYGAIQKGPVPPNSALCFVFVIMED